MAETTLILALEGEVWLADFASAITHFQALVDALGEYLNRDAVVHWELAALTAGSASTTIRGVSLDREFLAQVSNAFLTIGEHMQQGKTIPYPHAIAQPATQLTQSINGRITAIRLATAEGSARIATRIPSPGRAERVVSYGEIRGTVETLQRRQHRFTLYEDLFDHGVVCRLQPEQEEMMRQFWGREVVVQGEIERDATTHRPVEVRSVDTIQLLGAVPPGSYERARGILPFGATDPIDVLRRLRDAE